MKRHGVLVAAPRAGSWFAGARAAIVSAEQAQAAKAKKLARRHTHRVITEAWRQQKQQQQQHRQHESDNSSSESDSNGSSPEQGKQPHRRRKRLLQTWRHRGLKRLVKKLSKQRLKPRHKHGNSTATSLLKHRAIALRTVSWRGKRRPRWSHSTATSSSDDNDGDGGHLSQERVRNAIHRAAHAHRGHIGHLCAAVAQQLGEGRASLTHLDLSSTSLTDNVCADLAAALAVAAPARGLIHLNLSRCGVASVATMQLCQLLRASST